MVSRCYASKLVIAAVLHSILKVWMVAGAAAGQQTLPTQIHNQLALHYDSDTARYLLVPITIPPPARLRGGTASSGTTRATNVVYKNREATALSQARVLSYNQTPARFDDNLTAGWNHSMSPVMQPFPKAHLLQLMAYNQAENEWLELAEMERDGQSIGPLGLPWEHVAAVQNATVILWPSSSEKGAPVFYEIPYEMKQQPKSFSEWAVKNILEWSMRNIERGSNIRFRHVRPGDQNWIQFEPGELCLSRIGRRPDSGSQRIMLNPKTCLYRHAVQHEILHSLGFYHEHQRIDHGKFVVMEPEAPNDIKSQLIADARVPVADKPYDMASIMHYHAFLRATDPRQQSIIETRSPTLSSCDWNLLNTLYPGDVQPPPCLPHQHIRACESLPSCPFSARRCAALCALDCDAGLSRGDIVDDYRPPADAPYCRYLGGLPFPPLPSSDALAGSNNQVPVVPSPPASNHSHIGSPAASVDPAKSIYNVPLPPV